VRLLIRDDFASLCPDSELRDFCQELFLGTNGVQPRKQTTNKIIFTPRFPHDDSGTICLAKKYTSRGFIKTAKEILRHSKALHEFLTAVSISQKDIPVPEPIIVAETLKYQMVKQSLLLMSFISGAVGLKEFLLNRQEGAGISCFFFDRREIINDIGRLTAKIFKAGIYQDDYALNNFILQQEGGIPKIYFIDFERVEIREQLSEQEKAKLLTKINRVGCEVTVKDRLRFLKSYIKEDTAAHKNLKQYARELQRTTLAMLKRDLQRGRLTSVYTAETYKKFKNKNYHGICHKDYREDDLLNQAQNIQQHEEQTIINLNCGNESHVLKLLRFKDDGAEKLWAAINVLKLVGLPIDMPQGFIETKSDGFLMMKIPESGGFATFESVSQRAGFRVMQILEEHFPEQLKEFSDLLARLLK
jgi:tRNA A-37 threonylcarbamoyl transferase component Bud32